ncbi:P-loop containing nucleoside triphosphate hydrolase protein [Xylariaceae sp. FL0662B]|nr:P-loop containing nucleoside triphosphate hydrolase protein [Xylariaceae sp. FL0662B]
MASSAHEAILGNMPNGVSETPQNEQVPSLSTGSHENGTSSIVGGETSDRDDRSQDAAEVMGTRCETEPEASKEDTMKCAFKHLDRRYDGEDKQYYEECKAATTKPEQKDSWRMYAFCVVRDYARSAKLKKTYLYVNSQPLRQLLKDVIGNYHLDPIDVNDVQIQSPYGSLFYYREKLEVEGNSRFEADEESRAQFEMLLDWINTNFESSISAYNRCISGDIKAISYEDLWTLFPPEKIFHSKVLNQSRAFKVLYCWYQKKPSRDHYFYIHSSFIDSDGEKLGTRTLQHAIPKYPGMRELSELSIMPLDLMDNADEIRAKLIARGRKFESYIGQHFEQYNGIAVKKRHDGYKKVSVIGRIMIDCKTFHRLDADDSFIVDDLDPGRHEAGKNVEFGTAATTRDKLSDDDVLLTNATVRGYAFTVKQFFEFFVDAVSPIQWNSSCFDHLVLDQDTKKTVQALVSTHSKQNEGFADIVEGKGQGLVFVLHGPPGVGKTLTAECVAEYLKRPLYMVSSGDLGTSGGSLDMTLTDIMDMATTWKAVLLIDEADVFLERRSLHDVHRNAMVSVFLRVLDYYGGILFLTTNRVSAFDDAFKSRIHIPIRYTHLSRSSRQQIWRDCCARAAPDEIPDEAGLAQLARHELNGRQIKNVVACAASLAAFDGAPLDLDRLRRVAGIQAAFERDLSNPVDGAGGGPDYAAPGEARDADRRNMFF